MSNQRKFVSASRLNDFFYCSARYWYAENRGKGSKKIYLEKGSRAHEVIASAFSGKPLSDEDKSLFAQVMGRVLKKIVIWPEVAKLVEVPFSTSYGDYIINGIEDFRQKKETTVNIIDWKTGFNVMSQEDAERSIQLLVYIIHEFTANPEVTRVFMSYAYTDSGIVRTVVRERSELPAMQETLTNYLSIFTQAYNSGVFEPEPHASKCAHCPCLRACSANAFYQENKSIEIPLTDKDFSRLYKKITTTQEYIERMNEALKGYAVASQKSEIDGVSVKIGITNKFNFSTKKDTKEYLLQRYKDCIEEKVDTGAILEKLSDTERQELIAAGHLKDQSFQVVKIGG